MASKALIVAHDNLFNKAILKENAYYFANAIDVKNLTIRTKKIDNLQFIENNFLAIAQDFNWNFINGQYLQLFQKSISENQ